MAEQKKKATLQVFQAGASRGFKLRKTQDDNIEALMADEQLQHPAIQQILIRVDVRVRECHRKARTARAITLFLKSTQIVIAGSIPILALAHPSASIPSVNGILGALIVIIEGFQHSFQFEQFWVRYRQAAYSLDNEKSLYLANAGPYRDAENSNALFAERVAASIKGKYILA